MSVQQPGVRRPDDGQASYPDPKRSWGRSGSLLATWVVLLLAVYLTGWMFDGILDKSAESIEDEAPGSAKAAVWQFMNFALEDRRPEDANGLLCSSDVQLSGSQIYAELTDWEETTDVSANVTFSFEDESMQNDQVTLFLLEVRFETGTSIHRRNYEVSAKDAGDGTYCVSKVENVTKAED